MKATAAGSPVVSHSQGTIRMNPVHSSTRMLPARKPMTIPSVSMRTSPIGSMTSRAPMIADSPRPPWKRW